MSSLSSLFVFIALAAIAVATIARARRKAHRLCRDRQTAIAARLLACTMPLGTTHPESAAALRFVASKLANGLPFDGQAIRTELDAEANFPRSEPVPVDLDSIRKDLMRPTNPRDADGFCIHPALPSFPEGTDLDLVLRGLGFRAAFVSMETDCADQALVEKVFDEGTSCLAWEPTPPQGDGWNLLEIYDTEEGPHALFVRPMTDTEVQEQIRLAQHREDTIRGYQSTIADVLDELDALTRYAEAKGEVPRNLRSREARRGAKHIGALHAEIDLLRHELQDIRARLTA
jgi:hypothetical protein